jgi:hypothetical protein
MRYQNLFNDGYYEKVFPYNTLDKDQLQKFLEWSNNLPRSRAADGAQFTWHFTPTGLGMVIKVSCGITGQEIDLSDYESW